jgi:putative Mg2+ transporter-C (MgtC) family protein
MLESSEVILRIGIAALLGGLVGLEREVSDQPAGFRTHILVSLGAALFTLVGAYSFDEPGVDATRVAAQVVTGIGFIGAGVIFQQGASIKGLTTAASLWVTAAIGTAVGLGYWDAALATTVITVISLYGLKRVGRNVFPRLRRESQVDDEEDG